MLSKSEFDILNYLRMNSGEQATQRIIAEHTNISLGKVNSLLKEMKQAGLVTEELTVTLTGYKALKPFRVTNAVIMAAGMSSRFAPLSYEKPKALLNVKGEILIEREIRQLHEAGIRDITLVVGYMKEKLFYLADKYDIDIVVNEDYYRYNNTSTLSLVMDRLDNTYICSSDNYFAENPFEEYVYRSYYSAVYSPGETDEYCMTLDKNDRITKVSVGGSGSWYMIGHVYWSREFSKKFAQILKDEYQNPLTKEQLWENLYMRYIDELDLYIRRFDNDLIKEFDSLDELRAFDSNYLKNTNSQIMVNICNVLDCKEKDIVGITPIKIGLTNLSFQFECKEKKYVYRHPGDGTEGYINRFSEAQSMKIAKELGLDNTFIYIDENEGWKISYFIDNAETMDYHNEKQVSEALMMLRKLHDSGKTTSQIFDIYEETKKFLKMLDKSHKTNFEDMSELIKSVDDLHTLVEKDDVSKCLCHCDSYSPNFLIDKEGKMYLIDWEYSGVSDPGCDIGTFIACADYSMEEAEQVIDKYLGEKVNPQTHRHFVAYVAIAAFYWFVWALYQESIGKNVGEYLYIWYRYTKSFGKKAFELYKQNEEE